MFSTIQQTIIRQNFINYDLASQQVMGDYNLFTEDITIMVIFIFGTALLIEALVYQAYAQLQSNEQPTPMRCSPVDKLDPTTFSDHPYACKMHTPQGTCTHYEQTSQEPLTFLPPGCSRGPTTPEPEPNNTTNFGGNSTTGHKGPVC